LWVLLAAIADVLFGIALMVGFCTRLAALGAFGLLLLSAYAIEQVKGDVWLWGGGGYEYSVFWAVCCLAVAIEAWKAWFRERRGTD
jgi:putative oxidoreductase